MQTASNSMSSGFKAVVPVPDTAKSANILRPFPYFYYVDFANTKDIDPTLPLTGPGKVPNFPAKMHDILSRKEFQSIVSWMPHGRSWRIHKPQEFESYVIPKYFEHVKYTSFLRQANGWGFCRITIDNIDRNSYFHPRFLRGLPHLCKGMKRPRTATKCHLNPKFEPDLNEVSKINPLPEHKANTMIPSPFTLNDYHKSLIILESMNVRESYIQSHHRTSLHDHYTQNEVQTIRSSQESICTFQKSIEESDTHRSLYMKSLENFRKLLDSRSKR